MPEARALAQARCGSVIAPAGCGKTELIARAISVSNADRTLVLTHTHAGVKAVRDRLARYGITSSKVRVDTIAGWCLRYASAYPAHSGFAITEPVGAQWGQTYLAAARLLDLAVIRRVVAASYSDVYVDEYQDCNLAQHEVIRKLAGIAPCRVLGDPLQGIFDFAGPTIQWSQHVVPTFPPLMELSTPWRWRGRNEALGEWLLQIRGQLIRGETIDLARAPLTWAQITVDAQREHGYRLHRLDGSVIALRKWPDASHEFARHMGRIYRSMEEMECNTLLNLARELPNLQGPARVFRLLRFAADCMTGLREGIQTIWDAFAEGRVPDVVRLRSNRELAAILIQIAGSDDITLLQSAARLLEQVDGTRLFRTELWHEFHRTLSACQSLGYEALAETAWAIRNRLRYVGRTLDRRTVSRTLLIKGLECDHACILDLDEYEDSRRPGQGAKNAYVALTRGAVSLTILSATSTIQFSRPTI